MYECLYVNVYVNDMCVWGGVAERVLSTEELKNHE